MLWRPESSRYLVWSHIDENSYKPFFPMIQRAARKAPRANPTRLRAVCVRRIVSASESNPISWVPG
jgi:hypothetical protein